MRGFYRLGNGHTLAAGSKGKRALHERRSHMKRGSVSRRDADRNSKSFGGLSTREKKESLVARFCLRHHEPATVNSSA